MYRPGWIASFIGCALLAVMPRLLLAEGETADGSPPPRKLALLVGVKDYNHAELPNLRFAENDVEDLAAVLRKHQFHVVVLTTAAGKKNPALNPTCENVQRSLKELLGSVTKRDLIVVGLAGHGIQPLGSDSSYFCPMNGNPTTKPGKEKNDPNVAAAPETLLSIDDLLEELQNSGVGQKLLLVDACRNDPKVRGRRGVEQVRVQSLPTETGILLSCSAGQFAFEHQSWGKRGNGAFFSQIIAGMDGAAADETGLITYESLAMYVRKRVPKIVQQVYGKDGGEQRPNEIKNFSGDLISLAIVSRADSPVPGNTLKSDPGQTPDWGLGNSKETPPTSPLAADPLVGRPGQERVDTTLGMKFTWCRPGTIAQDENDPSTNQVASNPIAELAREYEKAKSELQSASAQHRAGRITSQDYARYRLNLESAEKRYNSARSTPQLPTQTVRHVNHKGFWIGVYEVKQSEWLKLMKTKPWLGKANARDDSDAPVTYVSWHDAVDFCKKLTIAERQTGGISMNWRYSLPSEAQWEYACRATTSSPFSFGREISSLENFGWFKENATAAGEDFPHAVGQKRKNHWGLYDMHGNVAEWCTDLYAPTGAAGGVTNAVDANQRVVRGGSFHSAAAECRSSYHYGGPARVAGPLVGFRVVLAPKLEAPANRGARKRAD